MDRYFQSGLASSTSQAYDSAKRRYLEFSIKPNLHPLPVSEDLLCRFVGYLADDGLAPSSIKCYLSAVRHLQIAMHMEDPNIGGMARLEQVLKGAKRKFAEKYPSKKPRMPMTPDILLQIGKYGIRSLHGLTTSRYGQRAVSATLGFYSQGR